MNVTPPRAWLMLLGLQALVALAVFSSFFSGQAYFAYLDIGSDSYGQVLPDAMHMARKLASEGFTGWSFELGLGGPTNFLVGDVFSLMGMLGGPDAVLSLRIWVYMLKITLGGSAFLLLIRCYVTRWETAVITALAYSFCGFIVVNGQWDVEATGFVFFPLVAWAITRHLRTGGVIMLPLVTAATLLSGVFFVSVGAFFGFACLAFVLTSPSRGAMLKIWLTKILPLAGIGFLLAAPRLVPIVLQVLDTSRVSGGDALFQKILQESFSLNSWMIILAEVGGLFHKDIFGVGNAYQGYWNYLEGPGFFIGVLLFVLIPQVWSGAATDRKVALLALGAITAYFIFPLFRNLAMGFAVPYFRTSTLWVSLVFLMLAAKAMDQVLKRGVDGRLLAVGLGGYGLLLILVWSSPLGHQVWPLHVFKVLGLMALAGFLLLLAQRGAPSARLLPLALLAVVATEAVLMARPSYVEGRSVVTPTIHARAYNDGTLEALQTIRRQDKSVFRIEKTYHSVSLADSRAQDYMGVKSYALHSRGLVDFYIGMGLIPATSEGQSVNYTNWLPNGGSRYALNSLLGVKYIIAKEPLQWPGFTRVSQSPGRAIYLNQLALPLGIVQTRQVTQATLSRLSSLPAVEANSLRDIALINAVVVPEPITGQGALLTYEEVLRFKTAPLDDSYVKPALDLQATGLQIETFSSNHILGTVSPLKAGLLVFSIPVTQGWSLTVDGQATPLQRANYGMLAAPVQAGNHKVVLVFDLPGRRTGGWLGAFGVGLLALVVAITRRRKASAQAGASL